MPVKDYSAAYQRILNQRLKEYNDAVKKYYSKMRELQIEKLNTPTFFDYVSGGFTIAAQVIKGYKNGFIDFGSFLENVTVGLINDLYETGKASFEGDFDEAGRDFLRGITNPVIMFFEAVAGATLSIGGAGASLLGVLGEEGSDWSEFWGGMTDFTKDSIENLNILTTATRSYLEGEVNAFNALKPDGFFGGQTQRAINKEVVEEEMFDTNIFGDRTDNRGLPTIPGEMPQARVTYGDFVKSNAATTLGIKEKTDQWVNSVIDLFGLLETTENAEGAFGGNRLYEVLKGTADSVGNIFSMKAIGNIAKKAGLSNAQATAASRTYFFSNISGRSINDAISKGANIQDAFSYGLSIGLSETLIEGLFGVKFGSITDDIAKGGIAAFLKTGAGEGIEEVIAEFIAPGYEAILNDGQAEFDPSEIFINSLFAFGSGMLASSAIGAGQAIVLDRTVDRKNEKLYEKFKGFQEKYGTQAALEKYKLEVRNIVDYLNRKGTRGQVFNENGASYIAPLTQKDKDNFVKNNLIQFFVQKNENGQYVVDEKALDKLTEESFQNKNQQGQVIDNTQYAINDSVFGVDITDKGKFNVKQRSTLNAQERLIYTISQKLNAPIAIYEGTQAQKLSIGNYGENGVFYINSKSIQNMSPQALVYAITKHEAVHALKIEQPALYEELRKSVETFVKITSYDNDTKLPIVEFLNEDIKKSLPNFEKQIISAYYSYANEGASLQQILELMNEEIVAYFVEETITDGLLVDVLGTTNKGLLDKLAGFFGLKMNPIGNLEVRYNAKNQTLIPYTKVKEVNSSIKSFVDTWRNAMTKYAERRKSIVSFISKAFDTEAKALSVFSKSAIDQYGANTLLEAFKTYDPADNTILINNQKVSFDAVKSASFSFDNIRPQKVQTMNEQQVAEVFIFDNNKTTEYFVALRRLEKNLDAAIVELPRNSQDFKDVKQRLNVIEVLFDKYRQDSVITPTDEELQVISEAYLSYREAQKVSVEDRKKYTYEYDRTDEQRVLITSTKRVVEALKDTAFNFKNRATTAYGGAVHQGLFDTLQQAEEAYTVVGFLINNYTTQKGKNLLRDKYYVEMTYDAPSKVATFVIKPTLEYFQQQIEKRNQQEQQDEQETHEAEVDALITPQRVMDIELSKEQRQNLQKYYTSQENAKQTFDTVIGLFEQVGLDISNFTIIESSAGNGSFIAVFKEYNPDINVIAYDLVPETEGIIQQDFLKLEKAFDKKSVVIGNPPFKNNLDIDFINKSLEISPTVAFILPGTWMGSWIKQSKVNSKAKLVYSKPLGTQPFAVGDQNSFVKVSIQVWSTDSKFKDFQDLRLKKPRRSSHPDFILRVLDNNPSKYQQYKSEFNEFDFAVRLRGGSQNYNKQFTSWNELTPTGFWMIFKTEKADVLQTLKAIDFEKVSTIGNTLIKGFNASDIVQEYEKQKLLMPQNKTGVFDSNGFELTQEQFDYFSQSKVRKDGKLLVLYHGSLNENITSFSQEFYGQKTGVPDKYIFFTNDFITSENFSKEYLQTQSKFVQVPTGQQGKVYTVYADMKNPLDLSNITEKDKQFITEAYAEGFGVDLAEARESMQRMNFNNHQMVKIAFTGDQVRKAGYDGLIAEMYMGSGIYEYGVFEGSQIKAIENQDPLKTDNIYDDIRPQKAKTRELTEEEKQLLLDIWKDDAFIDTNFEVDAKGNLVVKERLVRSSTVKRNYAMVRVIENKKEVVKRLNSTEYAVNVDLGYDVEIDLTDGRYKNVELVKLEEIMRDPVMSSIYQTFKSVGIRFIGYKRTGIAKELGFSQNRNQNDTVFINFQYLKTKPEMVFETIVHEFTHEIFKTNRQDLVKLAKIYQKILFAVESNGRTQKRTVYSESYNVLNRFFEQQNGGKSFVDYLRASYKEFKGSLRSASTLYDLFQNVINGNIDINNNSLSEVHAINEYIAQITGYIMSSGLVMKEVFKLKNYEQIPLYTIYEQILQRSRAPLSNWIQKTIPAFHNAYIAHQKIMEQKFPGQVSQLTLKDINKFIKEFTEGAFTSRGMLIKGMIDERSRGIKGNATITLESIIKLASKYAETVQGARESYLAIKAYFEGQLASIQALIDNPQDAAYLIPEKIGKEYKKILSLFNKIDKAFAKSPLTNPFDNYDFIEGSATELFNLIKQYMEINPDILSLYDLPDQNEVANAETELEQAIDLFEDQTFVYLQQPDLTDPNLIVSRTTDTRMFLEQLKKAINVFENVKNLTNPEYSIFTDIGKLQAFAFAETFGRMYLIVRRAIERTTTKINTGNQGKSQLNVDLRLAYEQIDKLLEALRTQQDINPLVFEGQVLNVIKELDDIASNSEKLLELYAEIDNAAVDVETTVAFIRRKYVYDLYGFYGAIFNKPNAITDKDYGNFTLEKEDAGKNVEELGFTKNYYGFAKAISKLFYALETQYLSVFGEIEYKELVTQELAILSNVSEDNENGVKQLLELSGKEFKGILTPLTQSDRTS
jgi:hypothetical protein